MSVMSIRKRVHTAIPSAMDVQWDGVQTARVTTIGSNRLLVENYTGIVEFTEQCVRLSSKRGMISVEGSGLSLENVRPQQMTILGRIAQVTLPDGGHTP